MSWHRAIYFLLSRKHTLLKAKKVQDAFNSWQSLADLTFLQPLNYSYGPFIIMEIIIMLPYIHLCKNAYIAIWYITSVGLFLLHPLIKSYLHNNHIVNGCRDISTVNSTVTYIATQQHIRWMLHDSMGDDTKPRLFCERLDASSAQAQEFTLRTLTQLSKNKICIWQ